jgi:hypothetical protein
MADQSITFLPFLKRQPPLPIGESDSGNLIATLNLKVMDNKGNPHPVGSHSLIVRDPGDILGISRNIIARIEPPPGTHDFEPNYFPFIEFADPDFLWRYSLDNADASSSKVHPWLSLIVLSMKEIDEMTNENIEVTSLFEDRRGFLSLQGKYLPNLEDAWAAAHVHLSDLDKSIDQFIERHPYRHCSRLFCFRRLAPETNYMVFLVPNYKIAVQAAFGLGQDGAGNEKAWLHPAGNDIIKLPIYFSWSFSTSEFGDFEHLARNLKPTALDPEKSKQIGTRAVDANLVKPLSEPQYDLFFLREGALAAPGYSANLENKESLPITDPMLISLNQSLKSPKDTVTTNAEDDEDPLITLPVYGRYFRKTQEAKMPLNDHWPEQTPWIHELNVHFRNRVAAALGTTAVQKNQDDYMKECWSQVGEIRKANEKLRLTQTGYLISKILEKKHIMPLSDYRFVLFSTPFHPHVATEEKGEAVSLKQELADSGISPGVFSSSFRRLVHRQIGIRQVKPTREIQQATSSFHLRPIQPRNLALPRSSKIISDFLNKLPGSDTDIPGSKKEIIPIKPFDVSDNFRAKFDIGKVLRNQLKGIIVFNDDRSLPENFDPIMRHPKINFPMYKPLTTLSNDYILPGIENLENNGVTLFEENRRFIEAYMVGLNHEMGRELVWRNYPTDQRGTIFSYFWDQVVVENPPPDIKEIHKWAKNLGKNKDGPAQNGNLILVINGDFIRRYPGTIVYALKILPKGNYWSESYPINNPPMNGDHIIDPVFRAQIGEDILAVGFPFSLKRVQGPDRDGEYYFILQENQDLPRFGLDVAGERLKASSGCDGQDIEINDLRWSDVTIDKAGYLTNFEQEPLAADASKPTTSAMIASKTYQLPMRVAIHASELLSDGVSS